MAFDFWAGWAGGITALGLLGLVWLAVGVLRDSDARAPDTAWDDEDGEPLREGNDEPPKWWFFGFFAMLMFSVIYVVLYPGFGDFRGVLNWSQERQLEIAEEGLREQAGAVGGGGAATPAHARWLQTPLAQLRREPSAMASARRIFAENCANCHGRDARGQAGLFPNLMDDKWQWGADADAVIHSIARGRRAVMPGWEGLGEEKIAAVTDYVFALSEGRGGGVGGLGAEVYAANCVSCHGVNGEGNVLLGAPAFDGEWLYAGGGDAGASVDSIRQAVEDSIRYGRDGEMPAQENRLTRAQIRLLAAWLTR